MISLACPSQHNGNRNCAVLLWVLKNRQKIIRKTSLNYYNFKFLKKEAHAIS